MLTVLELIAARQPIGVSALAKLMDEDKSAVQRALMTLADAGWVRAAPEPPTRWELTAHIFTIAHLPHSTNELRQRARGPLEALRETTGETVFMVIPDIGRFVVVEVVESPHPLRMALRVGEIVPLEGSATSQVVLAHLSPERRTAMLGREPAAADVAEFAQALERGYGLSVGGVQAGSTTLAAPIFDADGQPMATIGLSGPSDRVTAARCAELGALLVDKARSLSRGAPASVRTRT
jgi:IclR family acetate operon transcriptional repressor